MWKSLRTTNTAQAGGRGASVRLWDAMTTSEGNRQLPRVIAPTALPVVDASGAEHDLLALVTDADHLRAAPAAEPATLPRRRLEVGEKPFARGPAETRLRDRHDGRERGAVRLPARPAVTMHHRAGGTGRLVADHAAEAASGDPRHGARSSAARSQPARFAAASYVVCRNASSVSSGFPASRTASYGRMNSCRSPL
jgi:hypothetical protein